MLLPALISCGRATDASLVSDECRRASLLLRAPRRTNGRGLIPGVDAAAVASAQPLGGVAPGRPAPASAAGRCPDLAPHDVGTYDSDLALAHSRERGSR